MKTVETIRPPIILKTILDILFWVLIISIIFGLPVTIIALYQDIPVEINNYKVEEFSAGIIVSIILSFLNSIIFIYIVYLFRKVVRNFFKRKLFTAIQISGLKLIGQLIIITCISEVVIKILTMLFIENRARVGVIIESSFDSLWFTLALGLFFILLSKSFSYARKLQEENELTV